MTIALTDKQSKLFEYIMRCHADECRLPTVSEMSAVFERDHRGIHDLLLALHKKGFISTRPKEKGLKELYQIRAERIFNV
jgi:hypothetical protein